MNEQLVLQLGHRPAMGAEDFLVAAGNAEAVAWVDRWPDWPVPAVVVHGPLGCGKTHLTRVWRGRARAAALSAADLIATDPLALLGGGRACAIDDADQNIEEEALLHLYNVLVERRGTLLLTAASAPRQWNVRLPDLRSRLLAAATVRISPPDEAFIAALIVKLFADRQIQVRQDVVEFLAVRLERSFVAVRRAVEEIDRAALAGRRPITIPLVRTLSFLRS